MQDVSERSLRAARKPPRRRTSPMGSGAGSISPNLNRPSEEYEVGFDVIVTQPWVTAERTARIEATLANEANVKRYFNPALLHSRDSENKGVRVWGTKSTTPNPKPWCTGGDGIKENPGRESGEQPPSATLEPGETYRTLRYVVDDEERLGCYPSGVYRFPNTQSVIRLRRGRGRRGAVV